MKKSGILFLLLFLCFATYAQQADSAATFREKVPASTSIVQQLQKAGKDEALRSIEKYKMGRVKIERENTLEALKKTTRDLKIFLERGFDTISLSDALKQSKINLEVAKDGIFTHKGSMQTQRNLSVSAVILNELLTEMMSRKNALSTYTHALVGFRDKIDSINSITALYTFPEDSVETMRYYKKLVLIVKEIGPPDTALTHALGSIEDLQTQLEEHVFELQTYLERVEKFRIKLSQSTQKQEVGGLNEPPSNSRPISEILRVSYEKEKMALGFYTRNNKGSLILLFFLMGAATIFLIHLKKKWNEMGLIHTGGDLVLHFPFFSAILITISLFQFLFIYPPFIFSYTLWLASVICLTLIFKGLLSRFWMRFWIILMILFLLTGANNMVLQASRPERWYMLIISLTGAGYGIYGLVVGPRHELKEKSILYFIAFMVIFEICAALTNIMGRYNLSKTFLVSGFIGAVIAIMFLWTVRLLNQSLSIISKVYKHPDKKLFYINFERLGDKVPTVFYVLLVFGWAVLVGKNFYGFQQVSRNFNSFLNAERTLGNYSFSVNGLFVFLIILAASVLISKIISFFATDPDVSHSSEEERKRVGLGSWILLIRIFIISMGLFLAFAASGIPLDKLTIILGALGVGVGLGLQGLVNNLVSGLIIAFEKPVNVGDVIELGGKTGTMKSIGFRSSVVSMSDGHNIIIPNGDLLSQQLVNWTGGKGQKKVTLNFGVAYGTDIDKTISFIKDILVSENGIIQRPPSIIVPLAFGSGAIELEVSFVVNNFREASFIRGNVIKAIDKCFKQEGIEIAIPQQEVFFHSASPQIGQVKP